MTATRPLTLNRSAASIDALMAKNIPGGSRKVGLRV
jgi:hypothetical protein